MKKVIKVSMENVPLKIMEESPFLIQNLADYISDQKVGFIQGFIYNYKDTDYIFICEKLRDKVDIYCKVKR